MRTVEHRRHSRRDPGDLHLSAAGRALARKVGPSLPRFDRVVTSPRDRAIETAEELGHAVDGTDPALAELPDDLGLELGDERFWTFERIATLVRESAVAREYAAAQAERWRTELERVPDGGHLLIVSHGSIIVFGTVGALGDRAAGWGPAIGYLEGVRLRWDGRRWVSGEVLRLRE
ncbi:MAG TPA: histidine phosphatase family protein [Thermoplasmata archaeon]|nr:histidine phosphatase family protein [Thermoplasmata archaeon]